MFSNKFKLEQSWTDSDPTQMPWMDYVKYYVKETSNEYYNLVLDRWYDAGDGNIWLAFPSVDRNKVDEETYLILKNEHGSQRPVVEKARYKIIAIENEAPDYIKTDYRKFARIEIDRQGIYGVYLATSVSDAVPDGLISTNKIRTSGDLWDEEWINNSDFKGTPKVRIVGEYTTTGGSTVTRKSPWKTVSRVRTADSGSRKGADLQEVFTGDEVNMYLKIQAGTDDIIDASLVDGTGAYGDAAAQTYIHYYMEFRDEVVENRPQFDGRFFVKIEKDDILT